MSVLIEPSPLPLLTTRPATPLASTETTETAAEVKKVKMASLLGLSHELLHDIFADTSPRDLAALSATCRALHSYVRGNRLLHRAVYLSRYDVPSGDAKSLAWETLVHDACKLEQLLQSADADVKREHLQFAADQIARLTAWADADAEGSRNLRILEAAFQERQTNVDAFLCSSSLFDAERAGDGTHQIPAPTSELCQAAAKLHCLYGVPIDVPPRRSIFSLLQPDLTLGPSACTRAQLNSRTPATHPWARARVYDLRTYTAATLWGPFRADGTQRVDWEKVEAIMIVLGYNLRKFSDAHVPRFSLVWKQPFRGAAPHSYRSPAPLQLPDATAAAPPHVDTDSPVYKIRELALALDAQDPYGVSGSWMRVVCFLDYNDLYAYNFADGQLPAAQHRGPIETDEGLIRLEEFLQVTRVDPPDAPDEDDSDDEWADDDIATPQADWSRFKGTRLPVVHFRGTSRSLHASWDPNANSGIRGTVRQTPEGEIRWTTFSIFHGEERWRSEGIQVGGLRSARGVLGNWFDKDYDMHGPAGPTAFWKESDEVGDDERKAMGLVWGGR